MSAGSPCGQPAAVAAPHELKVEKVDLTEEEVEDVSLDATLGYVAEYEGQYSAHPPDLTAAALAAQDPAIAADAAAARE